ncbi:MAG: hypothetical protein ACI8ZB_004715 [Desulforhopalus sp.]|jgi:hypothetical protein
MFKRKMYLYVVTAHPDLIICGEITFPRDLQPAEMILCDFFSLTCCYDHEK